MTFSIPDELLRQAGLSDREARVEFACHLFQTGRLDLWPAAQVAGLSRNEMEGELLARGIPVYPVTRAQLDDELKSLRRTGK